MTGHDAPDVPIDELYDANAEYYDLITRERFTELAAIVDDWAAGLDVPDGLALLDIGPGTGRMTCRLAERLAPRPVLAIEPSRALRAILVSRIVDDPVLTGQVTVLPLTFADATPHLPPTIAGGLALGMLPHLSPIERGQLLDEIAHRLVPGGSLLLEVMPPHTAEPVPRTPMGSVEVGAHVVDCSMEAQTIGPDQLEWTMRYRRRTVEGVLLHDAAAPSRCWVVDPATVTGEAVDRGLVVTPVADDLLRLSVA